MAGGDTMGTELRNTGISVIGDVPWGTHFCYFYETTQDLLDTLVPFFMAGLKSKEFCLWIISVSEPLTLEDAKRARNQNSNRWEFSECASVLTSSEAR
jgi:hypothetical protein